MGAAVGLYDIVGRHSTGFKDYMMLYIGQVLQVAARYKPYAGVFERAIFGADEHSGASEIALAADVEIGDVVVYEAVDFGVGYH